jgi:hypothetical protein
MRAIRVAIEEASPSSTAAHAVVSNLEDATRALTRWTMPGE